MRVVTGIRVERRTFVLPPGTTAGDEVCADDPDDCCGSGSGSGSGGGEEPSVQTDCCENLLPATLYATFVRDSDSQTLGTLTLTWSEAFGAWRSPIGTGSMVEGCTPDGVGEVLGEWRLLCTSSGFVFRVTGCEDEGGNYEFERPATLDSCDPFQATITSMPAGCHPCDDPADDCTVTITETAP